MVNVSELKKGQKIKGEFNNISRDLIKRYSKLGGFAKLASNPIHDDDKTAKEAGHKGVIAHGLFSFGFITKLLDDFIEREKYGKIIKVGVEMRYPVRCGDKLITEAIINKIEGKRVYFDIKQKTITKIQIEREGKIIKRFEADMRNYISKKDYEKGYIKTKDIEKGLLYYRERVNSPGYAVVELDQ
ncbi:MAG: MaoC/PaaZ C-terminal domain-containing protein [Promethearchaeia archaeon]